MLEIDRSLLQAGGGVLNAVVRGDLVVFPMGDANGGIGYGSLQSNIATPIEEWAGPSLQTL